MLFFPICVLALLGCAVVSNGKETERRLLNDGNWMPKTIFGTYVEDYNDRIRVRQATIDAMEAGYRHIDTAYGYLTEDMIGEAIADVTSRRIVKRPDLFITTKLPFTAVTRIEAFEALKNSLKRLNLTYVDMCLIHTPRNVLGKKNHDNLEIWKGLEDAKRMGLTRSIGVSNFNSSDMAKILANSKTVPAVNQIETNPTFANQELVAYCQSKGIFVTGYSPFGFMVRRSFNDLSFPPTFDDPILVGMAKKYCVEVSQIVLRYLVDRQIAPIAASLNKEHIQLNVDIFGFKLSPEEVLKIIQFDINVKVYVIDIEGLFQNMFTGFRLLRRYVLRNNLQQYYENLT